MSTQPRDLFERMTPRFKSTKTGDIVAAKVMGKQRWGFNPPSDDSPVFLTEVTVFEMELVPEPGLSHDVLASEQSKDWCVGNSPIRFGDYYVIGQDDARKIIPRIAFELEYVAIEDKEANLFA